MKTLKIKTTLTVLSFILLFDGKSFAQKRGMIFKDKMRTECALTWNNASGTSKLFYFSASQTKYIETKYQLPAKPTGDAGTYEYHPYLDKNGDECVLTWNSKTGTSKIFYFNSTENKYNVAKYQLPTKPTGDEGEYKFMPFLDKMGTECVLTWNSITGTSKLFYFSASETKYIETKYQLPAKPTGDAGTYEYHPYIDKNGDECVLTWNSKTGTSKIFYFNSSENKYNVAKNQLPTKPTGDEGEYKFMPFIDKMGTECFLTWNSTTGTSKLFYFSASQIKYVETKYQLPAKPTEDVGTYEFQPYIDKNGDECVFTWNSKTGTSKIFYFNSTENKYSVAKYQLPTFE